MKSRVTSTASKDEHVQDANEGGVSLFSPVKESSEAYGGEFGEKESKPRFIDELQNQYLVKPCTSKWFFSTFALSL